MGSTALARSVEPASGGTLRNAVEALFRHKRLFLSVFGFCLLLTLLYVFVSHKKYESDMSVIVENNRKPEVLTAEATPTGNTAVQQVSEEDLYSTIEILGSADVLDDVVDPGWREIPVTAHPRAAQIAHEAKLGKLQAHLLISPVRKSNVIDVTFTANDPQTATATMQRVLDLFLRREQIVNQPAGASRFFATEAQRSQAEWAKAQSDLSRFQQSHNIVNITDKETDLSKSLSDTQTLLRAADVEITEVSHRLQAEQASLAKTPERQHTLERTLPASGSIDQINTLLAQLSLKRSQLLTEYLPTDPLVQQVDSQIADAQKQLDQARNMNSVETQTGVNPTWQTQSQSILDDQAHLRAVTARRETIAAQVADLQGQIKQTEQDALEFNTLQQRVSTLGNNYQNYVQKRDASAVSEAMDQHGFLNVGVAQSPTFSLSPVRPRPLIDTILGFITSCFLAAFVVYIAEAGRQTIATPAELDIASSYPVLATVGFGANTLSGEHLSPRAARSILGALRPRVSEARKGLRR